MCLLERRKLLSRNNATYIHKLRKFLEKTYKSLAKVFKVTDYHIGIEMAQAVISPNNIFFIRFFRQK